MVTIIQNIPIILKIAYEIMVYGENKKNKTITCQHT